MIKFEKKFVVFAILILLVLLIGLLWDTFLVDRIDELPEAIPDNESSGAVPLAASVATDLEIPWALDFLPDGSIVFTERPGRIRMIDPAGVLVADPLLTINEVEHRGEGGLLGIVVHPDFQENGFIYVYYTFRNNGNTANRVVRFVKQGNNLLNETVIIDDIPGAFIHNGGRIKFGPDGFLYITTGDAANSGLSRDKDSLAGKILRLEDDGSVPGDNPFPGSPVYSSGHRNPQGLAWDDTGRLWSTEHGQSATDELNLIEPGKDYGWPTIRGDQRSEGLEGPVMHSGSETWAPSGMAYHGGSLFFSGLRGQSLYEAVIEDGNVTLHRHLNKNFGRLRDVVVGPDDFLYVLTNNRDGRGVPARDDDLVIRINPGELR